MSRRGAIAATVAMTLLIAVAGCSGSSDGPLATSGTTTAASVTTGAGTSTSAPTTTTTVALSGEVGADGVVLTLDDGASVDVPSGALPAGTTVVIEPIDASGIEPPEGTTFVGPAMRISAPAEPEEPVVVALPIPDGSPPEDLWLLHVADDGSTEIVGGSVERGEFVSAVRSFSDVALLHGAVSDILGIAGVPPVDVSFDEGAPEDSPLRTEQAQLFTGERAEPAPRVVRIVGPGELGTRDAAVSGDYSAVGFESRKPNFVEYTWNLYGGDGARLFTEGRPDDAEVSAFRSGRYTLTVDAYDPATGSSAFAAKRILVVEGFVVAVQSDRPLGYCCDQKPIVTFDYIGGTDPVVLDWAVGRSSGQNTFDEVLRPPVTWIANPISADTLVEVFGTDGGGATSHAELVLRYDPGGPDALLTGPSSVAVGQEAVFTVETLQFPIRDLRFIVWPEAAVEVDGRTATVVWDEPGIGRVGVFLHSEDAEGGVLPVAFDAIPVEVVGDPLPVLIRVPDPPAALSVGQDGEWGVRVRGGVVAAATGFRGYTVTVDFGDDSAPIQVQIPASTAARLTDPYPVTRAYDEIGDYTVVVTATSPDGASATESFPVTVADRIVLEGEWLYPESYQVYQVNESELEFEIRGTEVEITRWANSTSHGYTGFTIGDDGDSTFVPDCVYHIENTLLGTDLAFDPETQTISGTVDVHYFNSGDIGTNCPFGGRDGVEEDRQVEIGDATIVDGVIEMGWIAGVGVFTATVVEP